MRLVNGLGVLLLKVNNLDFEIRSNIINNKFIYGECNYKITNFISSMKRIIKDIDNYDRKRDFDKCEE